MVQQKFIRFGAGIVLAVVIALLAYTGTVSTDIAVGLIVGVAASLGLYEGKLRASDS